MHLLPVVPVVASLVAGVALSGRWPRAGPLAGLLVGALAIAVAVALAGRRRALAKASLIATALPLGWAVGARAHDRALERPLRAGLHDHLAPGKEGEVVFVEGRLLEDALPAEGEAVMLLDVHRVRVAQEPWRALRGGVRLGVPWGATADAGRHWRRGRCIRAPAWLRVPGTFRNPGVADADLQLARRGIALVGQVKSAALVEPCGEAPGWIEAAGKVRDGIRAAIERHIGTRSRRSAAIVTAILIGDRAAMDADVEERLRRAGTFHVIAISGGNIAILTGMIVWALAGLRAPPRWVAVTSIVSLILYGLCVVRGASVDRAIAVASTWLCAGIFDLRAHPVALLASVAGALVLIDPLVVFDPGFALTFGATLGLVALMPPLMEWWRSLCATRLGVSTAIGLVVTSVIATVAAEAGVLPIGAVAFGRVSLAGIVLNLIAVPMMGVAQAAGTATVLCSGWADPAAAIAGWLAHLGVWSLVESARLVEVMPWLSRAVPGPSGWLLLVYVAALSGATVSALAPIVRRASASIALGGAVAMFAGWWPAVARPIVQTAHDQGPGGVALRVTFLDVGQGDATVVQFPGGRVMLVDTGGLPGSPRFDLARRVVSPALHALGVRRLDWLVLTHGDPDHVGAAAGIVEDWHPAEVWEGIPVPGLAALAGLQAQAARVGIPWRRVRASDELVVDGVVLRLWHPEPEDWERQRVRNDDSIVIELRAGLVSVLLPGDIGAAVEQRLAASRRPGALCLLKAAHHGSAGSTSAAWLGAVRPAAVVFSCGRGNWFGHPAPAVLRRTEDAGARAFRTDHDGAIQLVVLDDRVIVETMTGRRWTRKVR